MSVAITLFSVNILIVAITLIATAALIAIATLIATARLSVATTRQKNSGAMFFPLTARGRSVFVTTLGFRNSDWFLQALSISVA
ncbi:hypothetical protein [Dickeya dadantii]|uniref:hypothetical protein n=1 Tax=Dickeya dadantii TaxID=204038 RepID=UPI001C0CA6B6|nr:hypothetical protein [Dickeya dadantii]QWT40110.1 hypothetical protein KNV89_17365 [Dickeya dadantii]